MRDKKTKKKFLVFEIRFLKVSYESNSFLLNKFLIRPVGLSCQHNHRMLIGLSGLFQRLIIFQGCV